MSNQFLASQNSGEETLGVLRIGVDLDEIVIGLVTAVRPIILEKLGVDVYDSQDFYLQEWESVTKIPGGSDFVNQTFQEELVYKKAKPIEGSISVLNKWRDQGHQIWFITARAQKIRPVTLEWMGKNRLGWAKDRLLFLESFGQDRVLFKAREVSRLNLHVFIEDQAEAIRKISSPSMMVKLILKYKWNENEKIGQGARFVNDWEEIDRIVQTKARQQSLSHLLFSAG